MTIKLLAADGSHHVFGGVHKVAYDAIHDEIRVSRIEDRVEKVIFHERVGEIDSWQVTVDPE